MSKLSSLLPLLLCLIWICVQGITARNNRAYSDPLLKSILLNKEVYDVRDVNGQKQSTTDITRKFGSDVRNAEGNNVRKEAIVETDITKDVNEENDLLLREIEAFLTLKRKKRWFKNDPSIRGTDKTTTTTTTSTTTPTSTTTTTTTTPAPTARPRTCRRRCFWIFCFRICN